MLYRVKFRKSHTFRRKYIFYSTRLYVSEMFFYEAKYSVYKCSKNLSFDGIQYII